MKIIKICTLHIHRVFCLCSFLSASLASFTVHTCSSSLFYIRSSTRWISGSIFSLLLLKYCWKLIQSGRVAQSNDVCDKWPPELPVPTAMASERGVRVRVLSLFSFFRFFSAFSSLVVPPSRTYICIIRRVFIILFCLLMAALTMVQTVLRGLRRGDQPFLYPIAIVAGRRFFRAHFPRLLPFKSSFREIYSFHSPLSPIHWLISSSGCWCIIDVYDNSFFGWVSTKPFQ